MQIVCPKPLRTFGRHALEHFRFSPNHGNALSLCFHAIPGAKPLRTFAGIALVETRGLEEFRQPFGLRMHEHLLRIAFLADDALVHEDDA
ncbi:hypothetical protein EEQ99_18255 [Rhizobium anhuiense]|uniref:Uncharacterized protein n=1 Tax=Rhizobium anhuiense TaxID=1184720 RepID=A0A3S0S6A9_9HYPH|nr:hypothetical protein EEQ99_18255 [Rhizobium anhuiense]